MRPPSCTSWLALAMASAAVLCASAGCGRLGFEKLGANAVGADGNDGPGGDGDGAGDGAGNVGGDGGSVDGSIAPGPDGSAPGSDAGNVGTSDGGVTSDGGTVPLDMACVAPVLPNAPPAAPRYAFDGTGTTIADASGTQNATAQNGASLDGSGVLRLDGSNDYVELPTGLLNGASAFTVMLWVQWDSGPQQQSLIELGSTDGNGNVTSRIGLIVSEPGQGLTLHVVTATQTIDVAVIPTLSTGGVNQVAFELEPATGRVALYLNGNMLGESTSTPFSLGDITLSNAWLGRPLDSGDTYFRGRYQEARFYDRALGPCAIAAAFDAGWDQVRFTRCAPPEDNCTFTNAGFWICPTMRTWAAARDLCADAGMWLYEMASSIENDALGQFTAQSMWTGLNDRTTEGSYLWCRDGAVTFSAWQSSEPTGSSSQSCVVRDGGTGEWRDEPCTALYAYACEP